MKITFRDFFLKTGKLQQSLYYFFGPEDFLKWRAKERLINRDDFKHFTKTSLEGRSLESRELWRQLSEEELFSSGQIIVLENAHRISASLKKELPALLEAWLDLAHPTKKILIMLSEAERLEAPDPLQGFLLANKQCGCVYFPALSMAETLSWARGELERRKLIIENSLLNKIAAIYGNDIYLWFNLMDRAQLCLKAGAGLDAPMLLELLGDASPQENQLWDEFATALAARLNSAPNASGSFHVWEKLEQYLNVSNEQDSSVALRFLRLLGDRVQELALQKAGAPPPYHWRAQQGMPANSHSMTWSWPQLQSAYDLVLKGEKGIKTGTLPAPIALRETLGNLMELLRAYPNTCFHGETLDFEPRRSRIF